MSFMVSAEAAKPVNKNTAVSNAPKNLLVTVTSLGGFSFMKQTLAPAPKLRGMKEYASDLLTLNAKHLFVRLNRDLAGGLATEAQKLFWGPLGPGEIPPRVIHFIKNLS
jgi:hypothetical protein